MRAILLKTTALLLLVVALVLVNDLASRLPVQADLTKGSFFTLSEASGRMLDQMTDPVQVELYFSASRPGLPIGLKIFAQRVEQLLRQYERRAGGKITLKVIDPVPGSREEEEARRLELASQPLGPDERLYFGLAVFHGGNHRTIPLIDFRRERLLEYDVSRLIHAVQTHRLPKLAIVSSLEVFGSRGMPKKMQKVEDGTAEWQFLRDLRPLYDLEEVMPTNDTLPADTDALLVINPDGFDPRLLHAIDQFILSGRPAVILLDPYCYSEVERDESDGPVIGAVYHKSSNLPEFLAAWGLGFSAHEVVGDLAHATEVPVQENQPPIPFPVWLTIGEFDDAQPVTAGFDAVLFPHVGYLTPVPSGARLTPLVRSSTKSAPLSTDSVAKIHPMRLADSIHPTGETYTLAAVVEGNFRTAFPGGKPPPPPGGGETGEKDPWILGLKASSGQSRVIVIADADLLKDPMAYQLVGRQGNTLITKPRNDNMALVVNSLEYLRGSLGAVPIRAKAAAIRPFVRIHQLKVQAEDRFRAEMQSINARLALLEEQLADLNRQATRGGGSLVSEKALTAIRRVQKEQNGLRARRTEIQHELQQTIAALNRRLTLLNLGVVPGVLALGGIGFWLYRTRRRSER
jgi:ABC-type uncharacterized transport system involved in gliding motility auxiliary subunit